MKPKPTPLETRYNKAKRAYHAFIRKHKLDVIQSNTKLMKQLQDLANDFENSGELLYRTL